MKTLTLVELSGTEKQITWANEIRNAFLAVYYYNEYSDKNVDEMYGSVTEEKKEKWYAKLEKRFGTGAKYDIDKIESIINTLPSAGWWIDNRDHVKYEIEKKLIFFDSYMESVVVK